MGVGGWVYKCGGVGVGVNVLSDISTDTQICQRCGGDRPPLITQQAPPNDDGPRPRRLLTRHTTSSTKAHGGCVTLTHRPTEKPQILLLLPHQLGRVPSWAASMTRGGGGQAEG